MPSSRGSHDYTAALANAIEEKWIAYWDEHETFAAPNPAGDLAEPNHELADRPKYYVLDMFPYPSGRGLHVGHPLGYIATDVYARFKRMTGFNVLHTMGYDAFGLPAERYAVDTGQHPEVTTAQNIASMRGQLHRLGLGHDPRRSVATTDVAFYHWTQWIFLQIFDSWYDRDRRRARPIEELAAELASGARELRPADAEGARWEELDEAGRERVIDGYRLAYLDDVIVNWCAALGTVLANEEVTADGRSTKGDYPVQRRPLRQWMMRITEYADRLIEDLADLEWTPSLKAMQRNWIGHSVGAQLSFRLAGDPQRRLEVFTTRPDTAFGVTYLAVALEHPLLDDAELPAAWPEHVPAAWRGAGHAGPAAAVAAYRELAGRASERERQVAARESSGVYTGHDVVHPLSGDRLPVFVADYVLAQYGSGAVIGVPAHDERDLRFARALGLPVREVVEPPAGWFDAEGLARGAPAEQWCNAYTGHGASTGAGGLLDTDGMPSEEAAHVIVAAIEERGAGRPEVTYKLRDWLFSRQRYWGEPIPIVYDEDGRAIALPESELPVLLPEMQDFAPVVGDDDADPEPPLSRATDWVHVELDLGDGPRRYRRETNTMPQWGGSCWYYLRYLDPGNGERFVDSEVERYWMDGPGEHGGVDLYVGGVEHAVLHLLYSRFWHKVLFDLGHVSTSEPFQRLFNQGYVQAWAYTDRRGAYVDAARVHERDGHFLFEGEPVERSYGKMGKSLKNGVAPDDVIREHGVDALRLYELFSGPLDQSRPWDTHGIAGIVRFLRRVWRSVVNEETGELRVSGEQPSEERRRAAHRAVAAVREDIEALRFNTAIASLMELSHELVGPDGTTPREIAELVVLALAPFAPHLCEELWRRLGHDNTLAYAAFPEADEYYLVADTVTIAVQVNGKLRGTIEAPAGAGREAVDASARELARVAQVLGDGAVRRVIHVPDRLINFVL